MCTYIDVRVFASVISFILNMIAITVDIINDNNNSILFELILRPILSF